MRVVLDFILEAGLEPDHGALNEQDLGVALIKETGLEVPLAPLDEHTVHIDTILWWGWVLVLNYFVVKQQLINWNLVLSSIILKGSSQETLGEEELIDPVEGRDSSVNPSLEELQPLPQISYVATQGLERGV